MTMEDIPVEDCVPTIDTDYPQEVLEQMFQEHEEEVAWHRIQGEVAGWKEGVELLSEPDLQFFIRPSLKVELEQTLANIDDGLVENSPLEQMIREKVRDALLMVEAYEDIQGVN